MREWKRIGRRPLLCEIAGRDGLPKWGPRPAARTVAPAASKLLRVNDHRTAISSFNKVVDYSRISS
jgi:hypothetical protein